jgi:hypothetical protein
VGGGSRSGRRRDQGLSRPVRAGVVSRSVTRRGAARKAR